MKIAIVHDWLYGGGAEKVVEALHELYPEAPIYTSYVTDEWREKLDGKVVTGYLQKWPFADLRKFLPLLRQWWFSGLDLSEYDLVISSSGNGEAKFIRTRSDAIHVCYCHTPTHFYWRKYDDYLNNPGFRPKWLVRLALRVLVKPMRTRDYNAAQKVDAFIANSRHIASDIKEYYGQYATVIHPPVDVKEFVREKPARAGKKSFIMWGRHVPYKRFDLAVLACNQLGYKLSIIGRGPDTDRLGSMAGPTVHVVGWAADEQRSHLISEAQGFIFPSEEDFGIAPVEALAAGLPVIAYEAGGALDYIHDGVNGKFFPKQSVQSLMKALQDFEVSNYDEKAVRKSALEFSKEKFKKKISTFVEDLG